ncbi:hypothetical protein D8O27_22890 [Burkholderia mallei]|uniref:Uncharacterized protein n=2 Tax=Burkholderia mallei TaxID=13373 RepID=A0AAX1XA42_BURML|nr:hypothetical protein BMAA0088 [Burkholderia mallei ATCC 23344]RKN93908.1 hypothetical protein D8O03_26215 [Burkholderia mallei]RKN94307.1 hypothetical protein D8O31_22475 [Burkholderia mallei]RKN99459.1 hypothetical protein D8O05_22155 [Burkholderia mallei]RKO13317.1 hypothetical protein D8O30_25545 [Burkholderia mallei]
MRAAHFEAAAWRDCLSGKPASLPFLTFARPAHTKRRYTEASSRRHGAAPPARLPTPPAWLRPANGRTRDASAPPRSRGLPPSARRLPSPSPIFTAVDADSPLPARSA